MRSHVDDSRPRLGRRRGTGARRLRQRHLRAQVRGYPRGRDARSDRGRRWGTISRSAQRDENDEGLTGFLLTAADFNGDGAVEAIIGLRYYSNKPVVALSLAAVQGTDREAGLPVHVMGMDFDAKSWAKGSTAAIDWNGDGRTDLVVVSQGERGQYHIDPTTGISPRTSATATISTVAGSAGSQRRPCTSSRTPAETAESSLHTRARRASLCRGTRCGYHLSIQQTQARALLLCTYYGRVYHLPLIATGTLRSGAASPSCSRCTMSRSTAQRTSISTSACPTRWNPVDSTSSRATGRSRPHGRASGATTRRAVPSTTRRRRSSSTIRTSATASSAFQRSATGGHGDARPRVGGVEGYVLWYKTLSTDPLRFALPERVRYGTTEIRRLATPDPAGGHHWGGSPGAVRRRHGRLQQPRARGLERERPPRPARQRHDRPVRLVPELGNED